MGSIGQRITALEQATRSATLTRVPGVEPDVMQDIKRVAATCNSADELAAYLLTLEEPSDHRIVSLDERREADAVRTAFARAVFDEVRSLPSSSR